MKLLLPPQHHPGYDHLIADAARVVAVKCAEALVMEGLQRWACNKACRKVSATRKGAGARRQMLAKLQR